MDKAPLWAIEGRGQMRPFLGKTLSPGVFGLMGETKPLSSGSYWSGLRAKSNGTRKPVNSLTPEPAFRGAAT